MLRTILFVTLAVWASCSILAEAKKPNDACRNFCKNGANCSVNATTNEAVCACASGFAGNRCQFLIDICSKNPCRNNATCNLVSQATLYEPSQFNCTCADGFIGSRCQFSSNPCQLKTRNINPEDYFLPGGPECLDEFSCQNNATCNVVSSNTVDQRDRLVVGNFTCACQSDATTGKFCQNFVNPCASSPCLNNGNCTVVSEGTYNATGRFNCSCPEGFNGKRCERRSNFFNEMWDMFGEWFHWF